MKKNLVLFLMLSVLLFSFGTTNVFAENNSGKCGDTLTWHLSEDGVLTISGKGAMFDYEWLDGPFPPWYEKKDLIKRVVIEDGVEYIGNDAFFKYENLTDVTLPNTLLELGKGSFYMTNISEIIIPDSVKIIGWNCFAYCYNLSSVRIGENVEDMGTQTFGDCKKLTTITIPKSVRDIGAIIFTGVSLDNIYYQGTQEQWNNITKHPSWDYGMQNREKLIINYMENEKYTDYAPYDSNSINVLIDSNYIKFDTPPQIVNGRTLVPMRRIFESLGADVDWDQVTQTAIGVKNGITVKIKIGENKIYKNDAEIEIDVPSQLINGKTMVPVRVISESFNLQVGWDGNAKTVSIIRDDNNFMMLYALDDRSKAFDKTLVESYLSVGWYTEPVITMYAPDGKTQVVKKTEVAASQNVGWSTEPFQTLYTLDGRSQMFKKSEVPAQLTAGWYEYPVVIMYALDGRTTIIGENEINAYEKVGWYYGKPTKVYALDGRVETIGENRVGEYTKSGWYTEPVVKMYAVENGKLKTINVLQSQVSANKNAGWRTDMPKSKVSTVNCDDCHGSGRKNCSFCNGLGFIRRFDGFLGDNNSGFNFFPSHSIPKYRNDPCILCSESGKETCDSCKGKGSVSTTVYYY